MQRALACVRKEKHIIELENTQLLLFADDVNTYYISQSCTGKCKSCILSPLVNDIDKTNIYEICYQGCIGTCNHVG